MAKEINEKNYMEALLRAALIMGDLHPQKPIREITIAGCKVGADAKQINPRCKMFAQGADAADGEDFIILFPEDC